MNLTILFPNKQNNELYVSLLAQVEPTDNVVVFDLPKFPSKKIEDLIKGSKNSVIVIINPFIVTLPQGFIQNIRDNCMENHIYVKGTYDDIIQGYSLGDYNSFKKEDSIWFHKKNYKARLRDFSSQMDFNGVIKALIRIIRHKVYFPKSRQKEPFNKIIKNELIETINEKEVKKEEERLLRRKEEQLKISMEKERKRAIEEHKKNLIEKKIKRSYKRRTDSSKRVTECSKRVTIQTQDNVIQDVIQDSVQDNVNIIQDVVIHYEPVDRKSVSISEIMLDDEL